MGICIGCFVHFNLYKNMSEKKTQPSDISSLSFEQALAELEKIVRKLESGQGDLESSIADYTRGTQLKEYCEKKLAEAKLRVDKIMKTPSGELALEPLDSANGQ
jgi:exodeoxyribonuclease VII small subunit